MGRDIEPYRKMIWHDASYPIRGVKLLIWSFSQTMTIKVYADVMQEFMDSKSSSWDPEADFKSWEKMKTLY